MKVRRDKQGLAALLLQMQGELGAVGRLPRALDPRHHDHHGVRAGKLERAMLAAQGRRQLVANDLDYLLSRSEAPHYLIGERPPADSTEEVVDHLERHVGLQQCRADLIEGRVHLLGMELASRTKLPEDRVETVAQRIEHGVNRRF